MEFIKFEEIFSKLSKENQFIIFATLQMMEHKKDNDKFDIKRGIDIARTEHELTEDELCNNIAKKFNLKDGTSIRETYKSMLRRASRRSDLYQHTLEELCIDELFIEDQSEYFQSRIGNFQWLYDSLLPKDKNAICFLVTQLADISSITTFLDMLENLEELHKNIGVSSID
ncbi:hypothetical protein GKZ28_25555 [Clostridium chromiireducens]|uniref:Uncharacterized protein n=1 Tax=Clostridium chromiireducens TaxID=225345 RepID=A0A964RSJ6_9CLOT|nr:hypothetical protein [Clostridium chromiireducens]MVX67022.1 hypothetical protein [Clostridium chromiireducens]